MRFLLALATLILLASPAFARFESAAEGPKPVSNNGNFNLGGADSPAQSFPDHKRPETPARVLSKTLHKKDPFICYGASCTCRSIAAKKNR